MKQLNEQRKGIPQKPKPYKGNPVAKNIEKFNRPQDIPRRKN